MKDFFKTKGDPGKLKTFTNTTLGESWSEEVGERPLPEALQAWGEHYDAQVPFRVVYLTAGIDSQLDRYEIRVWGWGPGEEAYLVDRMVIMGRHDEEATLCRVDEAINRQYQRADGNHMRIERICWDTGGIDPDIVYRRSRKLGMFRVIPVKGASIYGKPVANMPRKRNAKGVYLTEVGSDTAKEVIYARYKLSRPDDGSAAAGLIHVPNNPEIFDVSEAQQMVAEELIEKYEKGRVKLLWDSKKRRNEALDCFVYALAALRISISRWQLNLDELAASREISGREDKNQALTALATGLGGGE